MGGEKLLTRMQFRNGWLISSHILLGFGLFFMLEFKLICAHAHCTVFVRYYNIEIESTMGS